MKCPNCGKSLWFVKDVCPFCKTTIAGESRATSTATSASGITSIPGTAPSDGEVLVTLVKCETLAEADAIRAQLEAAEIATFLPDEALMQTVAWNVSTYGFIRVQVSSQDYETAKQLLSSMRQDTAEATTEPGPQLAELPLSWPMRCFAFAMPLLTCPSLLIFAVAKGGYSRQGCERKATELWHWFAGGVVFWVFVFVVFVTIRGLMK